MGSIVSSFGHGFFLSRQQAAVGKEQVLCHGAKINIFLYIS
jgi:hypothetical protein